MDLPNSTNQRSITIVIIIATNARFLCSFPGILGFHICDRNRLSDLNGLDLRMGQQQQPTHLCHHQEDRAIGP